MIERVELKRKSIKHQCKRSLLLYGLFSALLKLRRLTKPLFCTQTSRCSLLGFYLRLLTANSFSQLFDVKIIEQDRQICFRIACKAFSDPADAAVSYEWLYKFTYRERHLVHQTVAAKGIFIHRCVINQAIM